MCIFFWKTDLSSLALETMPNQLSKLKWSLKIRKLRRGQGNSQLILWGHFYQWRIYDLLVSSLIVCYLLQFDILQILTLSLGVIFSLSVPQSAPQSWSFYTINIPWSLQALWPFPPLLQLTYTATLLSFVLYFYT